MRSNGLGRSMSRSVVVSVLALTACGGLQPQRAPPMAFDPGAERPGDHLPAADAGGLPRRQATARTLAHASALGAVLCASIRATPESRFHTRRDGSQVWVTVIDRLRFRDRNEQYDLETSYGSRRHRQRDWAEAIQRELLETAR